MATFNDLANIYKLFGEIGDDAVAALYPDSKEQPFRFFAMLYQAYDAALYHVPTPVHPLMGRGDPKMLQLWKPLLKALADHIFSNRDLLHLALEIATANAGDDNKSVQGRNVRSELIATHFSPHKERITKKLLEDIAKFSKSEQIELRLEEDFVNPSLGPEGLLSALLQSLPQPFYSTDEFAFNALTDEGRIAEVFAPHGYFPEAKGFRRNKSWFTWPPSPEVAQVPLGSLRAPLERAVFLSSLFQEERDHTPRMLAKYIFGKNPKPIPTFHKLIGLNMPLSNGAWPEGLAFVITRVDNDLQLDESLQNLRLFQDHAALRVHHARLDILRSCIREELNNTSDFDSAVFHHLHKVVPYVRAYLIEGDSKVVLAKSLIEVMQKSWRRLSIYEPPTKERGWLRNICRRWNQNTSFAPLALTDEDNRLCPRLKDLFGKTVLKLRLLHGKSVILILPFPMGHNQGRPAQRMMEDLERVQGTLLDTIEHIKRTRDVKQAEVIQKHLEPEERRSEGLVWDIYAKPLYEVGGDHADVVLLPEKQVLISVGDAKGHGIQAALVRSGLHALLRTGLVADMKLDKLMDVANKYVTNHLPSGSFVTMVALIFDAGNGQIKFVNAGHPPILVVRNDGSCRRSKMRAGDGTLGTHKGAFTVYDLTVAEGEIMILYTDGITEVRRKTDTGKKMTWKLLGIDGFQRILGKVIKKHHSSDLPNILTAIKDAIQVFSGEQPVKDDQTILLCRRAT